MAPLRRRREGDPDCVSGDLVCRGVGDFEVVFGRGRGGAGEGGEVGLGEVVGLVLGAGAHDEGHDRWAWGLEEKGGADGDPRVRLFRCLVWMGRLQYRAIILRWI